MILLCTKIKKADNYIIGHIIIILIFEIYTAKLSPHPQVRAAFGLLK